MLTWFSTVYDPKNSVVLSLFVILHDTYKTIKYLEDAALSFYVSNK